MAASAPTTDLLDLKLLPAWGTEAPGAKDYSHFEGEGVEAQPRREKPHGRTRRTGHAPDRKKNRQGSDSWHPRSRERDQPPRQSPRLPSVTVRFLPHAPSLENVIAQMKSTPIAYSVFA